MNNKPKVNRVRKTDIICYVIAVLMAVSVVLFVSVGITTSLLRTNSFVQARYEKYSSQLLKELYNDLGDVARQTGLPKKAFTSAFKDKHMQSVLHIAANNTVKGFATDFSESYFLYKYCRNALDDYCAKSGIELTDDELNKYSCLAADAFNNTLGDESTRYIIIVAIAYTNKPIITMAVSFVAFFAGIFVIDFISYRRRKKYEYIGISLIISGEVLTVLPLFALLMKYTSYLRFTDVDIYNMAIADTLNDILKINMGIGVLILAVGIFLVVRNYRYYLKKARSANTEKEIVEKIRNEEASGY